MQCKFPQNPAIAETDIIYICIDRIYYNELAATRIHHSH